MIKLKTGLEVKYNRDFDIFFQNLIRSIISESRRIQSESMKNKGGSMIDINRNLFNEKLSKEIMDNSIFVAHQIFEIFKNDENLAKFLITGCLFNCAVLTMSQRERTNNEDRDENGSFH